MTALAASAAAAGKQVRCVVDEAQQLVQDRRWRKFGRVWEFKASMLELKVNVSWLLLGATVR